MHVNFKWLSQEDHFQDDTNISHEGSLVWTSSKNKIITAIADKSFFKISHREISHFCENDRRSGCMSGQFVIKWPPASGNCPFRQQRQMLIHLSDDMLLHEDLVQLLPMVNEANAISEELDKKAKFEVTLMAPHLLQGRKEGRTEVRD